MNKSLAPQARPWYGASWKVAAFACYAGLNGIARYLSGGASTDLDTYLPVSVMVFFQDLIALLILMPWLLTRGRVALIPSHLPLHLFRVLASVCGIITWYFALVHIPLAQAVALSLIGPIIGVIGAKWLLKEKLGLIRSLVIIGTLICASLLLHPGSALAANISNYKGLFFLISAAVSFALAKLATRKLAQYGETAQSLTSYLFIFIVPFSFIPALLSWVFPTAAHWPWLFLAGLLTACAIYCVSNALVYAEVSFLAPFDICQFILNSIVGYVAFTELPPSWVGWAVVAFIGFSFSVRYKPRE